VARSWTRKSARVLSCRDALLLLGHGDSPAIARLGRAAGMAAAGVNIATAGTLAFFELRDELVEIGNTTVRGLREKLAGVSRMTQTERITAAHSILVIAAFYETLDELPLDIRAAELTREEQVAIATGSTLGAHDELFAALVETKVPTPTPDVPFEQVLVDIEGFYRSVISKLLRFLSGLAAFEHRSDELAPKNYESLPSRAASKYEESFIALAAEVPEFALWASMADTKATRGAIAGLRAELTGRTDRILTGLFGVEQLLAQVSRTSITQDHSRLLAQYYRAQLDKPLIDPGGTSEGVVLPPLREIYVNPACQVIDVEHVNPLNVANESWWSHAPELPDIQTFLAGYLTSPVATRAPLVVLGQPGSGKSVLTRMLAANLPTQDYLPIRVELRSVPADAQIQDQIMRAVHATIDTEIDWPTLLASAGDALPLVLLDGFDEVLQATGVNQSNYLERVREFQERQAELGRPVAVLMTSRTSVAHRARIPDATVVVRLKPFDDTRIGRWLDIWAKYNAAEMAARDRLPLTLEAALAQRELAREPLLLLILALFDATDNALQGAETRLGRVELYENLLRVFARREVVKLQPELPQDALDDEVERELHRLSVAALAMFNRRSYSVSENHLNQDLKALLPKDPLFERTVQGDLNRPLTPAQLVLGRFFFIHKSAAIRDTGPQELVYEFLHATFGDFLVARLTIRAVKDVAHIHGYQSSMVSPEPPDLGFLYVAISNNLLCDRTPLMEFCAGMFERLPAVDRRACRAALAESLKSCFTGRLSRYAAAYAAFRTTNLVRLALVSANLVLLAVYADDSPLDVRDFAPDAVLASRPPEDVRQCWDMFVGAWAPMRSLSYAMVPWIRARYTLTRKEPQDGNIHGHRWTTRVDLRLTIEDGSPVSFWESHPMATTVGAGNAADEPEDLDSTIFEDFETPCGSSSGLFLREIALLGTYQDMDMMAPLLRYGLPTHRIDSSGVRGSVNRLLLELLIEPAPGTRRFGKYEFVLAHGRAAERLAALRLLVGEIADFDEPEAKALLLVADLMADADDAPETIHIVDAALAYLRHHAGGLDAGRVDGSMVWEWLNDLRTDDAHVQAYLEKQGVALSG
jgi:hypothetical protein